MPHADAEGSTREGHPVQDRLVLILVWLRVSLSPFGLRSFPDVVVWWDGTVVLRVGSEGCPLVVFDGGILNLFSPNRL